MKWISIILCTMGVLGCSQGHLVSEQIAEQVKTEVACKTYAENYYEILTDALIDQQTLPTVEELEKALAKKELSAQMVEAQLELYRLLTTEVKASLTIDTPAQLLQTLAELSLGDQTTPAKQQIQQRAQKQFAKVQNLAQKESISCDPPPVTPAPTPVPQPVIPPGSRLQGKNEVIQGALRVLTTAYQGCQALELPAVTKSTPDTQGIQVIGNHPAGGLLRKIASLQDVQKTHFYVREGSRSGSSCFKVPDRPLVYDFGGKPFASSNDSAPLDMFRDAGSGTGILGIDCSAFVFASLASQGLRLTPGRTLKASQVHGVNSTMMMNPSSNGLSCLAPIATRGRETLRAGDILAIRGHVVIIDVTEADPLGLARARSIADCRADLLTESGFRFDVLQSSPVKGAMGLMRMRAKDYLATASTMKNVMIEYAVAACRSQFGEPSRTPMPSTGRLVRHRGTADCRDRPIELSRESCVRSCYEGGSLR